MKLRNIFSVAMALAVGFTAVSCSDDDAPSFNDDGSKVELPAHRMYILNEGSIGLNNAGIAFYAPDGNAPMIDNIFYRQNGVALGDTGQSLIEHKGSIYVAVYGSGYMARLNSACVEQARVSFVNDPDLQGQVRCLAADGGYVYASFYGGVVAKINASTLAIEAKLRTPGKNLEDIVVEDGRLYVTDSYEIVADPVTGRNIYSYLDKVYVIDLRTFTVASTLTVGVNPNDIIEEDDKVFLISNGNYADKGYSFQMIDPARDNAVTPLATATLMGAGNDKVYLVNSVTDWTTYTTTNTFFYYDIRSGRVVNQSFLKNAPEALAGESVYMIAVDDESGDIYIGVTHYTSSNGDIYRFHADGSFVEKFDCGGQCPRSAVFLD